MSDESGSATPGHDAETAPAERRRSVWVWVILVYAGIALLGGTLFAAGEFMGYRPGGKSATPLSPMYYAVAVTSEVVYLIGALALFNLRARAVPLFALALAFSVADMLVLRSEGWGALPDDAPGAEPGQQLATAVGSAVGFLVFAATLAYAARLRRRGVLR